MLSKLKYILAAGCLSVGLGCAHQYKPTYVKPPALPEMMEVEVGTCNGKPCIKDEQNMDSLLNNWLDLQAYIEQLKALGCFKK